MKKGRWWAGRSLAVLLLLPGASRCGDRPMSGPPHLSTFCRKCHKAVCTLAPSSCPRYILPETRPCSESADRNRSSSTFSYSFSFHYTQVQRLHPSKLTAIKMWAASGGPIRKQVTRPARAARSLSNSLDPHPAPHLYRCNLSYLLESVSCLPPPPPRHALRIPRKAPAPPPGPRR